jgi:hypothetical protein
MLINYIIHDFEQITITIETQEQMFVLGIVPYIVIKNIDDSVPNIRFGYLMLECGLVKLNNNVHQVYYLPTAIIPAIPLGKQGL